MTSQTLRVLSVDDNENDVLLLVRTLKRAGYTPEYVRVDTEEAMREVLQERPFDVVFLDHTMPQFSDIAALAVLREKGLGLPCIVLSGGIPEQEVVKAMKAGAHDFVHKRDLYQVGAAVERVIREVAANNERKRAESALRESEERYALAVQGSRDGIWDWNISTGYVYYSRRFIEMLGYDEESFAPQIDSFRRALHGEDRDGFQQALDLHWQQRAPFDVEVRLFTQAGECRWFSVRGQSLWSESGQPVRMAGSLSDLTERKLSEESLREKMHIIAKQQEAIHVLSTPTIEVWEGVLTVPVLTSIDTGRAAAMMQTILEAVTRTRCHHVILDLTGVNTVDTHTADHLIRLIRAVQLLGSQGIVVGIHPMVAQTLVSIGADLSDIRTMANLRDALVMLMNRRSLKGLTPSKS
jgi:anti-anti-sigma factor